MDGGAATDIGAGEVESGGAGAKEVTGGGGTGGTAAPPEWMASLPDDLKGDETLSRYKGVEDLARGHLETKRLATSKLAIPGKDAKPEEWNAVFEALGRPKEPAAYEIPLPEGVTQSPLADAFRPIAHEIGLLPGQVKRLGDFWNKQAADAEAAYYAQGETERDAVKTELGANYDAKREAAKAAFGKFFDVEDADMLDRLLGSGKLIRGAIKLAEATGEHKRVDGDGGDQLGGDPAKAAETLQAKMKDKSWRERYNAGDVQAVAEYDRLLKAAQAQAVAAGGVLGSFINVTG